MLLNPLSASTLAKYERLESRYIDESQQILSLSASGLWLKQRETGNAVIAGQQVGSYILQARHISQTAQVPSDVILFLQDADHAFIGRIDAEQAILNDGFWTLTDSVIAAPGRAPTRQQRYIMPTDVSIPKYLKYRTVWTWKGK